MTSVDAAARVASGEQKAGFQTPSLAFGTDYACLMTFRAEKARRNRWERVAALSSAARDGSGVR
jgi:hypothetical protein